MSLVVTGLMILTGVGAVIGMRKSKAGTPGASAVAGVCALLTIGLAVYGMISAMPDSTEKVQAKMVKFNKATGTIVGREVAEQYKGARVLVLIRPVSEYTPLSDSEKALIDGLTAGLGSAVTLVDTVGLPPPESVIKQMEAMKAEAGETFEDGAYPEMYAYELFDYQTWYDAKMLDEFIESRKDLFDVLVTTVGLPLDSETSVALQDADGPRIVVMNDYSQDQGTLLKANTIDMAVMMKPGYTGWYNKGKLPNDPQEIFDTQYLMVTAENLDEMAAGYPDLF